MKLDENDKVPAHLFEEAQKRTKFWESVVVGLFWGIAALVGGGLFTGFVLLVVFAISHPGAWVVVGLLTVAAVFALGVTQYNKNQKIVEQGQKRGVIDE